MLSTSAPTLGVRTVMIKRPTTYQLNYKMIRLIVTMIVLLGVCTDGSQSAAANPNVSRYDFRYYYLDGSGDHFTGYFYGPNSLYSIGEIIYHQNETTELNDGYYYIYYLSNNYASYYDGQEFITEYYDNDTGKTSNTLYDKTGQAVAIHNLSLANRFTTESGYIYDPSVPSTDAYFGNPDICYSFTPSLSVNFLAAYITDLPYWAQPETLYGSCAAVAGAIIFSYWDRIGFKKLITTDWQTLWPDNTANVPSYVSLINELVIDMNWGNTADEIVAGFQKYASDHGYRNFITVCYAVDEDRTTNWYRFKNTIDSGRPASLGGASTAVHHGFVGRGYWNDGHIVANMGLGTSFKNYRLDWHQTYIGESYSSLKIDAFYDFYSKDKIPPSINMTPILNLLLGTEATH
jgi:hypothetical protein